MPVEGRVSQPLRDNGKSRPRKGKCLAVLCGGLSGLLLRRSGLKRRAPVEPGNLSDHKGTRTASLGRYTNSELTYVAHPDEHR